MTIKDLNRRDALVVLGATLGAVSKLSAHDHQAAAARDLSHEVESQPRFFSAQDYGLIQDLSEQLIPEEDHIPGARSAGVPSFLDTTLLYADSARQQAWRESLVAIRKLAASRFGHAWSQCSAGDKEEIMLILSESEGASQTELQRFFADFKSTAVEAFCTSEVAMREYFHYKGNTALAEFPGCQPGEISENV